MVTNFSNQPGYIRISDVGTSQGAIDCTGIRLNAFLDTNANGVQDNGETNFPLGQFQYEMNGNGTVHNVTSPLEFTLFMRTILQIHIILVIQLTQLMLLCIL